MNLKKFALKSRLLAAAVIIASAVAVSGAGGAKANYDSSYGNRYHNYHSQYYRQIRYVVIDNFAFYPKNIQVRPGTTVVWVNRDSHPHTVTSTDGRFDSGIIQPGETYRLTFNSRGTFDYYCRLHPEMRGSVQVSRFNYLYNYGHHGSGSSYDMGY